MKSKSLVVVPPDTTVQTTLGIRRLIHCHFVLKSCSCVPRD